MERLCSQNSQRPNPAIQLTACRRDDYLTTHLRDSPAQEHGGVDLIFDALPFGRLWYVKPDDAIGYAQFFSRSHDGVIRVCDSAGTVIETHEHAGDFKEW
jgi:hypothetical protein